MMISRWTVTAFAAIASSMALPAVAGAHVSLQPSEAPAKGFVVEDVRVPTEEENASTTKVSVKFPDGFAEVSFQPVPGWTVHVKKTKLTQAITTDEGDKLTDRELFDQIFTICGAALSATSRAAGGALYALYSHPDQLAELIRQPSLIPAAVEECLRFAGNGYFTFPRIATRDTEVGGTKILPGMVVRPSPQAANYDPDVFPDPLRFDIHRNPKRILAFGAGPHHCVGNILGRTAIVIAITRLLARFPGAKLAEADFVPAYGGAVGELRLEHLPLRVQ